MKALRNLTLGALALLGLWACSDKDEPGADSGVNGDTSADEAYYASNAVISSSDGGFTATSDGGAITFGAEGGRVVVLVDCGTSWTAENSATDLFGAAVNVGSGTLTVTAAQNLVENEVSGTVTLMTSASHIVFATISVSQEAYNSPSISVETDEWHAPATGDLTTEIGVVSSLGDYTAESSASWLSVEKTDGGIRLTAEENADSYSRSGRVTVACTDGYNSRSAVITVTQDGAASVSLSQDDLKFTYAAGSAYVTVETDYEWTCSSPDNWITASREGDVLTVAVEGNGGTSDREGTVTVTASDGAENSSSATISVTQMTEDNALILGYTVTSADTKVTLTLAGTVDCAVDWGDGSGIQTVKSAAPSHTFTSGGNYEVTVNGTVTSLYADGRYFSSDSPDLSLTSVKQWGHTGLTSMYRAFYFCKALRTIPTDSEGSFADVTDFKAAFYTCTSLEAIPAGLFDKCPKVTNFMATFFQCSALTSIPEGLFDNCKNVTNFGCVFYGCTAIEAIPEGLFSGQSKCRTFEWAFYRQSSITSLPDKLFEGCSLATSFTAAFYMCGSLVSLPDDLFADCTNVTDFFFTFGNCTSLTSLPDNLFASCTNVTTFEDVFYYCPVLKSIPTGLFDNCKKVTNFHASFCNCFAVGDESPYTMVDGVKVHLYERLNYPSVFSSVTDSAYCFDLCTGLTDYYEIPGSWGGGASN